MCVCWYSRAILSLLPAITSMETSFQSPSIESFSYSWLTSSECSSFNESLITSIVYALDHDETNSFIEMDPRLPPSKRFLHVSSDFGFNFPISDCPLGLVHADELISNGLIIPHLLGEDKEDQFDGLHYYISPSRTPPSTQNKLDPSNRIRSVLLRRLKRLSSKLVVLKYLRFLLMFLLSNKGRGRGFESGDVRMCRSRNLESSASSSPLACSFDDNWRRSCDSESSIHEAVLHCKRTQGK